MRLPIPTLSWRTTLTGPFWICHSQECFHFRNTTGISCPAPTRRLFSDRDGVFGEIIRVILLNWYEFTGGPDGISGIPRPSFFGLEFKRSSEGTFSSFFGLDYSSMHRIIFLYYLILALAFDKFCHITSKKTSSGARMGGIERR